MVREPPSQLRRTLPIRTVPSTSGAPLSSTAQSTRNEYPKIHRERVLDSRLRP